MNEKRFEVDVDHILRVWDTEKNKRLEIEDIVDLLNEQQATIQSLKEENKQLKCINDQLEERLESSGIGVALKMDCDKDE